MNVEIINNKYRFGWKSIGVGSTKMDVEKAYKHVRKSPDNDHEYIDGDVYVIFSFDDMDVVKSIKFFLRE